MGTPRRPSPSLQIPHTPPFTPESQIHKTGSQPLQDITNRQAIDLTPPTSPRDIQTLVGANVGLGLSGISTNLAARNQSSVVDDVQTRSSALDASHPPTLQICPFEVEILKDECGRPQTFGSGAWSIVYKGIAKHATSFALSPTLPSSPVISNPTIFAVKTPIGRDAVAIIKSEALTLSHLASFVDYDSYIAPFHGIQPFTDSLVLTAIPVSLDTYIRECALKTAATATTWTMSDPVIGSTRTWLHLADQLITALAWLHTEAGVVHGDIKPGNILLQAYHSDTPADSVHFNPLFIDFSSSHLLASRTTTPNTLSAVTREYTAPELLSFAVLRNPLSTATTASDVFSLAVTLLTCATGNLMVYDSGMSMFQRQAMATQGWFVISNVRSGENGARVPRCGIVEQVLERAVLKAGMGRIDAVKWQALVREKIRGEGRRKGGIL